MGQWCWRTQEINDRRVNGFVWLDFPVNRCKHKHHFDGLLLPGKACDNAGYVDGLVAHDDNDDPWVGWELAYINKRGVGRVSGEKGYI